MRCPRHNIWCCIVCRNFGWLGLIGLLLVSGCAQRTEYVFAMHTDDTPADIISAVNAAEEWDDCDIVHVSVVIGEATGEQIPITKVDGAVGSWSTYHPEINGHAGVTKQNWLGRPDYIEYHFDKDNPTTQAIIAHEMGHALGLDHVANGLMRANIDHNFIHVSRMECDNLRACRNGGRYGWTSTTACM